jgi:O-antigen/teichoic acid export membrane protein
MVLPVAVSLITVPIYIRTLGEARYGTLAIAWVMLGYFGFFDLGISRASANALAKLHDASQEERERSIWTSFYLSLLLGLAGALLLYFAGGYLYVHFFTASDELKREITAVFPWIAALLPLALVAGVAEGALEARERFFALNFLQTIGTVAVQIVPVICAVAIGPSLLVVVPAAFASRACSIAAILAYVVWAERLHRIRGFNWSRGGGLLAYGSWVTVTNIISPLLATLDQLMIGSLIGARAVTFYSVPMSLVMRTQIVAGAMSRTLFPRMSRSSQEDAYSLAERAVGVLAYGLGAACSSAIILAGPFFTHWISPEFSSHVASITEILLVGGWVNGLAFIPFALLQGQGRPDVVAKFHALEVIPFIAVLWLFLHFFGLTGAAVAWTLRVTVDAVLLFTAARFRPHHALRAVPALALIAGALVITLSFDFTLGQSMALAGAIFLANVLSAVAVDPTCRQMLLHSISVTRFE